MSEKKLHIKHIGQVGFSIKFNDTVIYIDPYLSNSVEELENKSIKRLVEIPIQPEKIKDANYVLITHEHRDHCDEVTLGKIAESSKKCIFIGPQPVINKLHQLGFDVDRLLLISDDVIILNDVIIHAVPSAHPSIDKFNPLDCVGYIFSFGEFNIYHAGDTSLDSDVINAVKRHGSIDIGMIPVNERNYMRDKAGIIGNMTVREAFYFAENIGVQVLFPTHWDMFEINQVYKEEIELLYSKIKPKFSIEFSSKSFSC